MVGRMMLLKMLHCRRARQRNKKPKDDSNNIFCKESSLVISVKIEKVEEETCRVCLKQGMIPIYSARSNADLSEALSTFGGIYIQEDDAYPKNLCQSCHDLLQGAVLLRKTAQQSDDKLRYERQLQKNIDNYNDNDNDNRFLENNDHSEYTAISQSKNKKGVKNDVYKCKRCSLDFKSYEDLIDHRLSEEHENLRYTCPVCNKIYTSLYYKKHLARHTQTKSYMCDVCGKEFAAQNHFSRHRLTHFYDLPFKCSLCPYRGRFTESLKMHMRSHTGEKPYQCSTCSSRFVNKSNLNKHMLTHKSNHDFKCEDCGRGFYTKRNLELHFKVDHSGIKDHMCNICGKAFGYRKQMMKHQLKVHKREKLRSGRLPLYLQVEAREAQAQEEDREEEL